MLSFLILLIHANALLVSAHAFSPPVYPSRQLRVVILYLGHSLTCTFAYIFFFTLFSIAKATGSTQNWKDALQKAHQFVDNLSVQQQVEIATGIGWQNGPCVGNVAAQNDIGFPGLCLEDSPLGARFVSHASAFPAGITAATSWDRDLLYKRGKAMGAEAKGKGVNVILGPMLNMGRLAAGGRNWEGFGADPYLTGEAAFETVKGIQSQNVQASAKHYIDNEQEHYRTTESSNVDDRTQHEIYVAPFIRTVQAETASVMCSYNLINNSYACQNSKLLNGVLKTELAYDGYVMTDWGAHHSGVASANAGLDMSMPGDTYLGSGQTFWGSNLVAAVKNGSVDASRVQDMATRIIAGWYLVGQDTGFPKTNFDAWHYDPNTGPDVQGNHSQLIRQIDAAATVLLKNKGSLPLKRPRSLSVIGNDAGPSPSGPQYSGSGGPGAEAANGKPSTGVTAMGWGSGVANFPYLIDPLHALQDRCIKDRTMIDWWLDNSDTVNAARIASPSAVALVFISSSSGEEYVTIDNNIGDRNNLTAWWGGDELVKAVAAVNNNTIVVINSVGPMILEPWIDHPNITAVVWSGLPGQEAGNSLVDVLYGDVNPSGRLPYTIAKNRKDYGVDVLYQNVSAIAEINYHEGLLIDYRHFDAKNIEPRYEFGYGLSYTDFEYSEVSVQPISSPDASLTRRRAKSSSTSSSSSNTSLYGISVKPSLHKNIYQITVSVKNTGSRFGKEVVQLYLGFPSTTGEPPKVLRGFECVGIDSGGSETVTFKISQYDMSIWDVETQNWENVLDKYGSIDVMIGASSRDIRARSTIKSYSS